MVPPASHFAPLALDSDPRNSGAPADRLRVQNGEAPRRLWRAQPPTRDSRKGVTNRESRPQGLITMAPFCSPRTCRKYLESDLQPELHHTAASGTDERTAGCYVGCGAPCAERAGAARGEAYLRAIRGAGRSGDSG